MLDGSLKFQLERSGKTFLKGGMRAKAWGKNLSYVGKDNCRQRRKGRKKQL